MKNNISIQPAILAKSALHSRYVILNRNHSADANVLIANLQELVLDDNLIVGVGYSLSKFLDTDTTDFRQFPSLPSAVDIPATHGDLLLIVSGEDLGDVCLRSNKLIDNLDAFDCDFIVDGFIHKRNQETGLGKDLTGYEDGTENLEVDINDEQFGRAVLRYDNRCFLAIQQWQHQLGIFDQYSVTEKDDMIGRSQDTNEEISEAPESAHVKRTDQAGFDMEAHILRRSKTWVDVHGEGLVFVGFCADLNRFEMLLNRMAGLDDGIVDSLFKFSKPISGAYFCCPGVNSEGFLQLF